MAFLGRLGLGLRMATARFPVFCFRAPSCPVEVPSGDARNLWPRSGESRKPARREHRPTDSAPRLMGSARHVSGACATRRSRDPSSLKEGRMRTWTLVAAGLVAASVGTTAAVLPDGGPAAGQREEQKKPHEQHKK